MKTLRGMPPAHAANLQRDVASSLEAIFERYGVKATAACFVLDETAYSLAVCSMKDKDLEMVLSDNLKLIQARKGLAS